VTSAVALGAVALLAATACGAGKNTLTAHHCPTTIRLFFRTNASAEQLASATRRVRALATVDSVRFVSRAAALRRMRAKYPELFVNVPGNPLPASLEIQPKDRDHPGLVAASLRPLPKSVELLKLPSLRLCLARERLRKQKQ
jgi:cell division protein FtsX